jgi:hypothetical protein
MRTNDSVHRLDESPLPVVTTKSKSQTNNCRGLNQNEWVELIDADYSVAGIGMDSSACQTANAKTLQRYNGFNDLRSEQKSVKSVDDSLFSSFAKPPGWRTISYSLPSSLVEINRKPPLY